VWEIIARKVPYPFGTVTYDHYFARIIHATLDGLRIEQLPEIFKLPYLREIRGASRIADWLPLVVQPALGEYAACFHFAGLGASVWLLPLYS
jgi:hypothetical protein